MKCSKCGADNHEGSRICGVCGMPLTTQPSVPTQPTTTEPLMSLGIVAIFAMVCVALLTIVLGYFLPSQYNANTAKLSPPSESSSFSTPKSISLPATATLIPIFSTPTPAMPPRTSTTQRITIPSSPFNGGEMSPGCSKSFVISIKAGQVLALGRGYEAPNSVITQMTVRDPSNRIIEGEGAAGTIYYTATNTGDYTITFQGTGPLVFGIRVQAAPSSTQSTIPATSVTKRISFARGEISATVQGTTGAVDADHWVLAAMAGQTMSVNLILPTGRRATLAIYGADGTVLLSDRASVMQWSGLLPKAQDYFIDVKPVTGAVSYTLKVTVPPR